MAPYQPELWHDFFLATAGAAAALAGLLFVALSLHTRYIATNTVYRDMARGSVIGLFMALVLSLLVASSCSSCGARSTGSQASPWCVLRQPMY